MNMLKLHAMISLGASGSHFKPFHSQVQIVHSLNLLEKRNL